MHHSAPPRTWCGHLPSHTSAGLGPAIENFRNSSHLQLDLTSIFERKDGTSMYKKLWHKFLGKQWNFHEFPHLCLKQQCYSFLRSNIPYKFFGLGYSFSYRMIQNCIWRTGEHSKCRGLLSLEAISISIPEFLLWEVTLRTGQQIMQQKAIC